MNINGNDVTYYVDQNSPFAKPKQTLSAEEKLAGSFTDAIPQYPNMPQTNSNNNAYYIRDDKNYAWNMPQKYGHLPNWKNVYDNFLIINKENPIKKPLSSGNYITDFTIMRNLALRHPLISSMINAYNIGYMGAGYWDNLRKAYNETRKNIILYNGQY